MKRLLGFFVFVPWITFASPASFSDDNAIPSWSRLAIDTLVKENVFSGNSDGSFAPHRQLNRAEFCKILVQATGIKKYVPLASSFPDVERLDWFFEYVETARENGWLEGYPDGTFRPGGKVNRAEAAKILANAFGLRVASKEVGATWYEPYFQALSENELLAYDSSFSVLGPGHYPSRAEIAEQLFRIMKHAGKITPYDVAAPNAPSATEGDVSPTQATPASSQPSSTSKALPDDYVEAPTPTSVISASAGTLKIVKNDSFITKKNVQKGQKNIAAHSLLFTAQGDPVKVSAIQFRRVGNGSFRDFSHLWLEVNGQKASLSVKPTDDLVMLSFSSPLTIAKNVTSTVVLKADMASNAKPSSSRFVLFLPEWIGADAAGRTGFFPFGGADIILP